LAGALSLGTLTALALETAPGGFGGGQGRHGRHGMHRKMRMEKFAERLKLTAEQKQKLEAMHSRQKKRMQSQREQARADHQALQAELRKENPNQAEIQRLTSSIQQRRNQAMQERIQNQLEFNKTLTAEQRAELNKMAGEREQKRQEMRQRWEQRRQEKQQPAPTTPQQ
jgi:Spy/CpxP family protein refolding chaperone